MTEPGTRFDPDFLNTYKHWIGAPHQVDAARIAYDTLYNGIYTDDETSVKPLLQEYFDTYGTPATPKPPMTQGTSFGDFENTYRYYAEENHQREAVKYLYDSIPMAVRDIYFEQYRAEPESTGHIIQNVEYFSQLDNASSQGYRECFSSSCAMCVNYFKPAACPSDDHYNAVRSQYGDTTDAQAQVRAIRHFGLKADFWTSATIADLEGLIRDGLPVPCGWLHNGHVSNPSGGGHYSVVVGFEDGYWIHNDPVSYTHLTLPTNREV